MKTRLPLLGLLPLAVALALPAPAQDAFRSAFRTSVLGSFNDASKKLADLAAAIPDDAYGWRPAEGVRSVKEAVLHVAGANFFIGSRLGVPIPEGVDARNLDKTVGTKAEAIAVLRRSIDFARDAIEKTPDADLTTEVDLFGGKAPKVRVILLLADHAHEHLGQLIAYARSNKVAPPWSR